MKLLPVIIAFSLYPLVSYAAEKAPDLNDINIDPQSISSAQVFTSDFHITVLEGPPEPLGLPPEAIASSDSWAVRDADEGLYAFQLKDG